MPDVEITQDEEEIVTEGQQEIDQEGTKEDDNFDWRADALKHRAIASRLKVKLAKVPPITNVSKEEHKVDEELIRDVKSLKEIESKRQFGHEHSLSPEETDIAWKYSAGKPSKEVLEDPFFKAGIESLRSKKRLENNLPGSSSRSSAFTDKPFAQLDEDSRKNAFESKVKSIKG